MSDLKKHVCRLLLPLLQLKHHYQIQLMHLKATKREFVIFDFSPLK